MKSTATIATNLTTYPKKISQKFLSFLTQHSNATLVITSQEDIAAALYHDKKYSALVWQDSFITSDDLQRDLELLKQLCSSETRIILDWYNPAWQPLKRFIGHLGLRRAEKKQYISRAELTHILYLTDYDIITTHYYLLLPVYVPGLSWFCNSIIAHIPLIDKLCLRTCIIARARQETKRDFSVSVIVPCRNERGNVEAAIKRLALFGATQEIIFVEGNSQDGTLAEMYRIQKEYPERNITVLKQPGKGKGDAVRTGFSAATGDILMILDGDLTTPPEDMPKFYHALAQGKGEFINGSRLVYTMEDNAMQTLNFIANYCFGLGFSWLFSQKVQDTLCGTKVLFKKDYEKIEANRSFFGDFDPFGDFDLLFGAAKLSLKIIDVPVHYKNRTYGSTQIRRFYNGVQLLKMFIYGVWKFKIDC